MARNIMFDGEMRPIVENMGFNHSEGKYAKIIRVNGKNIVVTCRTSRGPWVRHRTRIEFRGKVVGQ